jgi:hypothetical protein
VCVAGERHGTPAERLLAAQRRANQAEKSRPHTLFATGPQQQPQHIPEGQTGGFGGGTHSKWVFIAYLVYVCIQKRVKVC